MGEIVEILLPQRQIEAELIAHPGNELGRCPAAEHRDGGIAWDQAHEHEDDKAHAEEDRHELKQPARDITDHAAPTPPSMVKALPVTKRASLEARYAAAAATSSACPI